MKQKLLLKSLVLLFALIAGSSSVWAQSPITIWSEDFSGYSADDVPSGTISLPHTGTVVDCTSGTLSYACTNGTYTSKGSTKTAYTKIYNENSAGGTAPELLVARTTGGSFTATIPLNNIEGTLTLTYYQNNKKLKVSSTTDGVSGGQEVKPDAAGQQTTTFTGITSSMTSITIKFETTTADNVRLDNIVLTGYHPSSISAPTFSPAGGIYTSAQSVSLACATDGTTIYYTTDGSTPTSSSTQFTGSAISVSSTTTIKAIAKKSDDYSSVSTATYAILAHAGTEADPFTVTDARDALDAEVIDEGTDYYVTGYVAKKNAISSGQMTYWISDDGGMTTTIQCFKGKYIGGANFTESNAPAVGDLAVVKGKLLIYGGTTYEFAENNEVVSIAPQPTITTTKTALSNIDYVVDNGPSDAQTFKVSGANLTANITLSLGESNYEMSLSQGSGYTNSLTLEQTAGVVAETTIYVRLKEGLAINAYDGTITLTSTGALNKTVSLAGSVTPPSYTFDLSKTDQIAAVKENVMTWIGTPAVMGLAKGSSTTDANNYYPGTGSPKYSSTRFYENQILTITPISGYTINSVVFTATTSNYATMLKNSTWANATAAVDDKTVTVTPTSGTAAVSATIGGTCGFTSVKVYYTGTTGATATITLAIACTDGAKYYGTYSKGTAFVVPTDMTVSEISVVSGKLNVEDYLAGTIVPVNTGVMVSSTTSGDHTVYLTTGGTSVLGTDNMLKPSGDAGISAANMTAADTKFYRLTMHNGTTIGFWWGAVDGAAFDLAANKAYLAVPNGDLTRDGFWFDDETAINVLENATKMNDGAIYDLSGRRVENPTKGIYIINGKKVIFK